TGLRKENLHLLPLRVGLVVALIFVVSQRSEIPDLVGELADVVRQPHRSQQVSAALGQRPLQRCVHRNLFVELVVRGLPRAPVRKNMREVPLESIRNLAALAKRGRHGGSRGGQVIHRENHTLQEVYSLRSSDGVSSRQAPTGRLPSSTLPKRMRFR